MHIMKNNDTTGCLITNDKNHLFQVKSVLDLMVVISPDLTVPVLSPVLTVPVMSG